MRSGRPHPVAYVLVVWTIFILYGTSLPLEVAATDWSIVREEWRNVLMNPLQELSLPDLISNIALFIPWGGLLAAWLLIRGKRFGISILAALAFGAALSFSIESLQSFMPTRTTSATDLMANATGAISGALAVWFVLTVLWPKYRPRLDRAVGRRPFATIAVIVAMASVVLAMEPFDFSIDVDDLRQAVKSIRVVPFGATLGGLSRPLKPWADATVLVCWILVGGALGLALRESGRKALTGMVQAAGLVGLTALIGETAQIVVVSRSTDSTSVLLAIAGGAGGAACTLCTRHLSPRAWANVGLVVWGAALLLSRWTPPEFVVPSGLELSVFVPFHYYYSRTDVHALADVVREISAFLPLGALLAVRWARFTPWRAAGVGFVLGLMIEAGQLFSLRRTTDVTDAISGALGAALGMMLWVSCVRLWENARRRAHQQHQVST